MSLQCKILRAEARITVLQERPKENGKIIAKLQRELRNMKFAGQELA